MPYLTTKRGGDIELYNNNNNSNNTNYIVQWVVTGLYKLTLGSQPRLLWIPQLYGEQSSITAE